LARHLPIQKKGTPKEYGGEIREKRNRKRAWKQKVRKYETKRKKKRRGRSTLYLANPFFQDWQS